MNSQPFLSIVIPTRDRPQLLRYPLWSLVHQTERDFEVIVCDNPTTLPARATFDEFADERFRYVRPEKQLGMVENWNFAISHARGTYVTILEDKFALRLDCVLWMKELLGRMPAEALHWYHDMFYPSTDPARPDAGDYYEYRPQPLEPAYYDPKAVLGKRLSWEFVRGFEGGMYGALKVLLGAYHRDLVERIITRTGKMFHAATPDYTSLAAAALLAKTALDGGRSGCVGIISPTSTGYQAGRHTDGAVAYLKSVGDLDTMLAELPLPGLLMSASNLLSRDYLTMCRLLPDEAKGLQLNYVKLHERCQGELEKVVWKNEAEKDEQFRILDGSPKHFPRQQRLAHRIIEHSRRPPGSVCGRLLERISEMLQPASPIPAKSWLWKRWTHNTEYKRIPFSLPLSLEDFLLYHQLGPVRPDETEPPLMSVEEIPPLKPEERTAALERMCRMLAAQNHQLSIEKVETWKATDQKLAEYRDKIAKLRDTIERREARIAKLETKLGIKPKEATEA